MATTEPKAKKSQDKDDGVTHGTNVMKKVIGIGVGLVVVLAARKWRGKDR